MKIRILKVVFLLTYAAPGFSEVVSDEIPAELQSLLSPGGTAQAYCLRAQEIFSKCLGMAANDCAAMMTPVYAYCAESTPGFPKSVSDPEIGASYEQCINEQYQRQLISRGYDLEAVCQP